MGSVDFKTIEEASRELERQAQMTNTVQNQIINLADENSRLLYMMPATDETDQKKTSDVSDILMRMREAAAVLETEALSLNKASEALRKIMHLYMDAEQKGTDTIHGEYYIVPRTEFGISYFQNLRMYDSLICISAGEGGADAAGKGYFTEAEPPEYSAGQPMKENGLEKIL